MQKKQILWFYAIVLLFIAAVCLAQDTNKPKERILHLPNDYSLGKIFIQDAAISTIKDNYPI